MEPRFNENATRLSIEINARKAGEGDLLARWSDGDKDGGESQSALYALSSIVLKSVPLFSTQELEDYSERVACPPPHTP